jgi:hypothetical protein
MMKALFGTATIMALVLATGTAFACGHYKSAQTTSQQTASTTDQLPLPADGSKTETKTGG